MNWFRSSGVACLIVLAANAALAEEAKAGPVPSAVNQPAYVIGRYSVTCEPHGKDCDQSFRSVTLYYRNQMERHAFLEKHVFRLEAKQGNWIGGNTKYDFVSAGRGEKGIYFCEPIPAGDYNFYTFDYYDGRNGFFIKEDDQFKLPFSVAPREVVYVGRLKVTSTRKKLALWMKYSVPGLLLLSSQPQNDIPTALQKCPEALRSAHVRDASLHASMAAGNALVQDEQPDQ